MDLSTPTNKKRKFSVSVSRHQLRRNLPTTSKLDTTNHQPLRHRLLSDRHKSVRTSFESFSTSSKAPIPHSPRSAPNINHLNQGAASGILVVKTQSQSLRSSYGSFEKTNSSRGSLLSTNSFGAESLASNKSAMSNVSFDKVCVREYPRCIGQCSVPSSGPPISIDWKHQTHKELPIDEYEKGRPMESKRDQNQMRMKPSDRIAVLTDEWQTSMSDIMRASLESSSVRERRMRTVQRSRSSKRVEEMMESARLSLKKVTLKTIKRRSSGV